MPDSASTIVPAMTSTAFDVHVEDTGVAPEAFFVDPRLNNQTETVNLPNQNPAVTATSFTIPLPSGLSFPLYLVPTHTTELQADVSSADGTTPVTFDMSYVVGDPDISRASPAPGTTSSFGPGSASVTLTEEPEVSPGIWALFPDEIGPYPPSGIPTDAVSASLSAVTDAFDPAVTSSTGDLWDESVFNVQVSVVPLAGNFLYLMPGRPARWKSTSPRQDRQGPWSQAPSTWTTSLSAISPHTPSLTETSWRRSPRNTRLAEYNGTGVSLGAFPGRKDLVNLGRSDPLCLCRVQ
jgi:hypothetical protein